MTRNKTINYQEKVFPYTGVFDTNRCFHTTDVCVYIFTPTGILDEHVAINV